MEPQHPEVTLGELYRSMNRLEAAVNAVDNSLTHLRTEIMQDVETRINDRLAVTINRLDRVEKVLYGAVALVLVAVAVALLSLVVHP